jgi:ABC-2 type transport system ATP-binding protein
MTALLEVNALTRHFGNVKAVNGISFTVSHGMCLGLLGPNGAGKTTTVEIMEGISKPDTGEILYKREPLGKNFRDQAGIMFQTTALQEFITVAETLRLFSRLYPHPTPINDLIASCSLGEFLDRDTRKLSGGQRQRLLLAIALINDPEIIFLDEPTTGLDPQARRNFWALIRSIKARNKTIIMTTHYMEEAYELCDEIIIMDHGKIIAQGTPKALLSRHFNDVILQLPLTENLSALSDFPGYQVHHENHTLEIVSGDVNTTLQKLISLGVSLSGLRIRERTLDDLFLELTGKEIRS